MEAENTLLKVSEIKTGIEVLQSKKSEYLELVEKSKDLKIDGVTDKENYELVRNHWKTLQKERISVEKQAKELRAAVKPVQEMISSGEKELLSIICPEEDRLYKEWKAVDEEKQRAKEEVERLQREKIAKRKARILDMGMIFDGSIYRFPGNDSDELNTTTDKEIEEALDEDFELILEKFQEVADAIAFAAEMEAKRKAEEEEKLRKEREELEEQKRAAEAAAAALKKQQEEQATEIERQRQVIEKMKRDAEEATRKAAEATKKAKEELRMRRLVSIGFTFDGNGFIFKSRAGSEFFSVKMAYEAEDDVFEEGVLSLSKTVEKLKSLEEEILAKEKAEIEEKARKEAEAAAERKRIAEEERKAAEEAARIEKEQEEKRKAELIEAMRPESEKILDMLQKVYDIASLPAGSIKTDKMAGVYAFYRTKLQALNAEVKQKISEHEQGN